MSVPGRYWRDAASLILACKLSDTSTNSPQPSPQVTADLSEPTVSHVSADLSALTVSCDYRVLMLQRSAGSAFMPSVSVFPGGVVDDSDFSAEWSALFEDVTGKSPDDLHKDFQVSGPRPPIITHNTGRSPIPPDVGFRICAIRETFEESGVLLVKAKHPGRFIRERVLTEQNSELDEWRRRVHESAQSFLDMCRHFEVVPDIWSLSEWSNWLTPIMKVLPAPPKKPHRYDTLFYICTLELPALPRAVADNSETIQSKWLSPGQYLLSSLQDGGLKLSGPQMYELSRIVRFSSLSHLQSFSVSRAQLGTELTFAVTVACSDGLLHIMPGDELYPSSPDYVGAVGEWPPTINMTCSQVNAASSRLHRSVVGASYAVLCNVDLACGHLCPVPTPAPPPTANL